MRQKRVADATRCRRYATAHPDAAQTNDYVEFCTSEEAPVGSDGKKQTREERHRSKTKDLGSARVPEDGFERQHVYGAIGIMIEMGITKLPRMSWHWSLTEQHDFPHIRATMSRDFFYLLMSRFFHLAPGGLPKRGEPGYDGKAHIRYGMSQHWNWGVVNAAACLRTRLCVQVAQ